jgi:hypothetical protein
MRIVTLGCVLVFGIASVVITAQEDPTAQATQSASPNESAPATVDVPSRVPTPAIGEGRPRGAVLYITPTEDHFETYLAAAMLKKGVPVAVTNNPEIATLVLQASEVEIQKQSTGSKFARCIFASCAGIDDRGSTSVQLMEGDLVVWSYSANKGRGEKNRQSLAEAVAKHLKKEYFERRR